MINDENMFLYVIWIVYHKTVELKKNEITNYLKVF